MSEKLPDGWVESRLDQTADLFQGYGFPEVLQGRSSGEVAFYKVSDISRAVASGSEVLAVANHYISLQDASRLRAKLIPAGAVVFARIGEAIKLNRRALLSLPALVDNNVLGVKAALGIEDRYLFYFLKTQRLGELSQATTVPAVRTSDISAVCLPVAPTSEQKRIVSKIDELFSSIDEGERALERVRKLVERYRQSVLKAAVTGELTRAWREQHAGELESGEALLTRILDARRQTWEQCELKRQTESKINLPRACRGRYEEPEASNDQLAYEVPSSWTLAGLDQLTATVERAIQSGPFGSNLLHSEFQSAGKLVIGIDNVQRGSFSLGSEHRISETKFLELEKYAARPKDFLITIMATIGRSCVLPDDLEASIISKHIYRFTLNQHAVLPEFVNLCVLGHPSVRKAIFGSTQGQTRPGLNKAILLAIPFPLPSLTEQQMICDEVSRLLSESSPLQGETAAQEKVVQSLRQAILKAAFSGQLVPQDHEDEPASVILERIAAEWGAIPKRAVGGAVGKQTRMKKTKNKAKA